nr:putative oxidoreductase [Quercus suber]
MSTAYEVDDAAKVVPPSMLYWSKVVHHKAYDRISPLRQELSARNKNVVVTGGGTGIGKAIAVSFAQAGARSVTILGRRETRLKEAVNEMQAAATNEQSSFIYQVTDLRKREEVDKALDSIFAKVGKLDILVSNAAALPELSPIAGYDANEFMRGFDMNVLTAFNAVQAFLSLAKPDAMIINISTALAHFAPMPGASGYGISKAANLKMMDYFAAENPEVHVVNVQPGTVATEMSAKVGVKPPDEGRSSPSDNVVLMG